MQPNDHEVESEKLPKEDALKNPEEPHKDLEVESEVQPKDLEVESVELAATEACEEEPLTGQELRDFLAEQLAGYQQFLDSLCD